jgi:predicted AlkP superfamily phosphohydrolase/phosphomutase
MYLPVSDIAPVMVSGLPASEIDEASVYPPKLVDKINEEYIDYQIIPKFLKSLDDESVINWINELLRSTKAKFEFADFVIREYNPEVFMLHVHETDILQHALWPQIVQPSEPVTRFYRQLDHQLKNFIFDAENTIILSDHGFRGNKTEINLNSWLKQNGYIHQHNK